MRIDVFTIFPAIIEEFGRHSLLGRAVQEERVDLRAHDIRDHAPGVHRSVDDAPYGGGPGMVMTPGPIFESVESVDPPRPLLLLAPAGKPLTQSLATELAATDGFSLLCGRYEGVDQRVVDHLCDGQVSVGDVVLNGGEVAALCVIEAVTRLVPGVMGNDVSAAEESFSSGLLEYPQYTRPPDFRGWTVPDVLRSGDHGEVARWRRARALDQTIRRRPDLLSAGDLDEADRDLLERFPAEPDVAGG